MAVAQLLAILGSLVVIYGLLRLHRIVVKRYVIPEIEPQDDGEE